jgi:hypothetical protein
MTIMKSIASSILLIAATVGFGALAEAANTTKTTVTIHADGTCQISSETTQPRSMAEQQVKMFDAYRQSQGGEGDDVEAVKPAGEKKDEPPKALTDAELAAKLRDGMDLSSELTGEEFNSKIETLDVSKDSVHMVKTRSLASIEELLSTGFSDWSSGLGFSKVRFEKDSKGQLLVTLAADPQMKRYVKQSRQEIMMTGTSVEFRMIFPGKILSSTFSNVQDNATWLLVDPKDKSSIDALMNIYDAPILITCELGGLKLDQPLDSKEARRKFRRGTKGPVDLPITEAGPGFQAEAVSVTTDTIYYF